MAGLYEASTNESAYGGIADSYAQKYGIPTDIFRDTIRAVSNFDPTFKSDKGSGIAGLSNSTNNKAIDPGYVGQSLDIAAQFVSKSYKDTGDWRAAAESFITGALPKSLAENEAALSGEPKPEEKENDKAFWRYSMDDLKSFFTQSAWAMLFFIIGAVLILASLYVVIAKGSDKGK
jgi:hypothetical protein